MTDEWQPNVPGAPLDGAPTWVRALQAGVVGLIAGLALYVIVSLVVLQARDATPAHGGPKECRKSSPARDVIAPAPQGPAVSSLWLLTTTL